MARLGNQLELNRCPHCGVDMPSLNQSSRFETADYKNENPRVWVAYTCTRCGGVITAASTKTNNRVIEIYPALKEIDETIPGRAKEYLEQAFNSINAPAGAVMLAASSVDSMLKEKGLKDGTLYSRIEQAVTEHLITKEMSEWAHAVRLDANEQRHADNSSPLPTTEDAKRVIDFAQALGTFLFVLPARVNKGIENAKTS